MSCALAMNQGHNGLVHVCSAAIHTHKHPWYVGSLVLGSLYSYSNQRQSLALGAFNCASFNYENLPTSKRFKNILNKNNQ